MVIDAVALLAGTTVLAAGACWSFAVRWVGADRTVARLHITPPDAGIVPDSVSRALHRAGIDTDHRVLVRAWASVVALASVLAVTTGGGVVLLLAAVFAPPGAVLVARGRAARARTRQLPLALDAIATGLRGGASLRTSLAEAGRGIGGPLGSELNGIAARASAGLSLAGALSEWAEESDDPSTRLAGAALAVAAELGGPGAATIDAAAASLRDRTAADDEISALSVQARLSALVLTVAPIGFAFVLTSLDPASARFLLRTPVGWLCVGGGLALDAAGAAWMARLVRGAR